MSHVDVANFAIFQTNGEKIGLYLFSINAVIAVLISSLFGS